MRSRIGFLGSMALAAGVTLTSAGAQGAVVVDIQPIATLQPGGKAVTATVSVACPARAPTDGIQENRLEVRQERRGALVIGVGGTGNMICDGKPHPYQITATVEEPTQSFGRGPAVANMFVLICDESGATCLQGDVTEEIFIAGAR